MLVEGGRDADGGRVVAAGGVAGGGDQGGLFGGEPPGGLLRVDDGGGFGGWVPGRDGHGGRGDAGLLPDGRGGGVQVIGQQPVQGGVPVGWRVGGGVGAGVFGDQIVEAVAAAVRF